MTLWTIQPEEVYRVLLQNGRYICDPNRVTIPDFFPYYDWLASE